MSFILTPNQLVIQNVVRQHNQNNEYDDYDNKDEEERQKIYNVSLDNMNGVVVILPYGVPLFLEFHFAQSFAVCIWCLSVGGVVSQDAIQIASEGGEIAYLHTWFLRAYDGLAAIGNVVVYIIVMVVV